MVTRMLPSIAAATLAIAGTITPMVSAQAPPIVRVVDFVVESVTFEDGELVANAILTLDVVGRTVTQEVQIPLELGGSPGAAGECDILNLAVGPLHLDLLGLVVTLDDCEGGPVTVDIVAVAGGGLLGDLLCTVAGLLDGGLDLGSVLDLLTDAQVADLTGALTERLNHLLGELLATDNVATHQQGGGGHRCDILTLEIPDGIHLDLLGLQVDTSGICLDVFAESGRGNLLGNLLCSVTKLLDQGNRGAARRLTDALASILALLDVLGL